MRKFTIKHNDEDRRIKITVEQRHPDEWVITSDGQPVLLSPTCSTEDEAINCVYALWHTTAWDLKEESQQ